MSQLTERKVAWDALESARKRFFISGGCNPNTGALSAHKREGRVLALAESYAEHGDNRAAHLKPSAEPGEVWEAKAIAGVE